MDNENIYVITKPEDLDRYIDRMFIDFDNIMDLKVKIDKSAILPLKIRIPSDEEIPYIDNQWMDAFMKARENIIQSLELGLERKLTIEERNNVKIKVYVEKGSRVFGFFADLSELLSSKIVEVLPNMTIGQILAVMVPVVVGYCVGKHITSNLEKLKENLAHQREIKRQESEDTKFQLLSKNLSESEESRLLEARDKQETTLKVIDTLDKILSNEQRNGAGMARQLLKMPEVDEIEINGEHITKSRLKELSQPLRKKIENERITINDYFKVSVMEFNDEETSVILSNENYKFKNFSLPKEHFSDKAINKINNREPLHLIITANKKNGIVQEILAISILDD